MAALSSAQNQRSVAGKEFRGPSTCFTKDSKNFASDCFRLGARGDRSHVCSEIFSELPMASDSAQAVQQRCQLRSKSRRGRLEYEKARMQAEEAATLLQAGWLLCIAYLVVGR